jgi:hypothetical protein
MKKSILTLLLFGSWLLNAIADDSHLDKTNKDDKEPISKGMYVHFGFGFPSLTAVIAQQVVGTQKINSLGTQFNLEAGNQWYLTKTKKMGFGLKISWLQLGFSSWKASGYFVNTFYLDTRVLKFGPQLSVALNDKAVVDFSVELNPIYIAGFTPDDPDSGLPGYFQGSYGLGASPTVRLRYGKLVVGADVAFSRLNTTVSINNSDTKFDSKNNFFCPRVFFGFKF